MDENQNFTFEPQDEENEIRQEAQADVQPVYEQEAQAAEQPQTRPEQQTYYQSQPGAQTYYQPQPGPQNYYQPGYPPVYGYPYGYEPAAPQQPKKKKNGWKIGLLIAAVAIVGVVGGTLLSSAIGAIRNDDKGNEPVMDSRQEEEENRQPEQEPTVNQPAEEEQDYELSVYDLPDELPSNDAGKSLTPVQVYEMTVNSVVGIETEISTNVFGQEAVAASSGSGFVLTEDGYVITNAHVVDGAEVIKVKTYGGETYTAVLVGSDTSYDVAVLKIEAEGLSAVSVGDSDNMKVGEEVAAIGNPLGELTFTMTTGIISALDREINVDGNPQNMMQTNAAINSGNSGGPLFDMDGNVIGVTTAKYSGSTSSGTTIEGLGFAIPINDALRVAYDLVEHGYVTGQAYLGVSVRDLDSTTASYYSLPVGPRVEEVVPGSCAEKAGMKVGDIIFSFNGQDVPSTTDLLAFLKKVSAGDTVTIRVYRAGAELDLEITLDERPRGLETTQQPQTSTDDYFYGYPYGN